MRPTTKALLAHYVDQLDLSGQVLEIGGYRLAQSAMDLFPEPRFVYHDVDLTASDIPNTIIANITDCRETIPDESFDLVISSDVFEHLDRPWLAAAEIGRILKPGGIAITHTLFAWRNHPCPIDYWRYSPECLEFLFSDLECLEKGYDLSQRRMNQPGFWPSGDDSVPVDHFGGWREHWSVYIVSRKGSGPPVNRFKDSDHPLAIHLRRDTQGVVTNPKLANTEVPPPPDPLVSLRPALAVINDRLVDLEKLIEINDRLVGLEKLVGDRIGQLDAIDTRSRRLERRIDRAVGSFPFRTVLRIRRGLHRLLK
jgi:SAM-dependent methyltransferase